jgi:methyl-branched lipid omega-hydroxylase
MDTAGIDLSETAFWGLPLADRAAAFATLRAQDRPAFFPEPEVAFSAKGPGFYALVRHADVTEASRHPEVFSSRKGATSIVDLPVEFNEYFGSMINMDDPRHARLRRIVSRAFSPRLIAKFEEDVRRAAAAIVDDLLAAGPCDFVQHVAARLPLKIICDMMGISANRYEMVLANSNIILSGADPEFISDNADQAVLQILGAGQALSELVTSLAAERAQAPGDAPPADLVSALVTANIDGEQLTSAELASFFILLVVAGNETTRNALSHALMLFTEFPAQRALLLADLEGRIEGAVDEIVRYASPVMFMRRTLTQDYTMNGHDYRGGPRRGGVRRPRAVRHHPLAEPARGLRRRRTAFLPGGTPGPPRDHRHAARTADPCPGHHRGRAGPAAIQLRQRHQAPALPVRRLRHLGD